MVHYGQRIILTMREIREERHEPVVTVSDTLYAECQERMRDSHPGHAHTERNGRDDRDDPVGPVGRPSEPKQRDWEADGSHHGHR